MLTQLFNVGKSELVSDNHKKAVSGPPHGLPRYGTLRFFLFFSQQPSVALHPEPNICRRSRHWEALVFQPSAKEKENQCQRIEEKNLNDILNTFLKLFIAGEDRRIIINAISPLSSFCAQRAVGIIKVVAEFIFPLGGLNSLESFPIPPSH